MKRGVKLQRRAKYLFCAVAIGGLIGCGNASSPDAAKVSDLKAASGLSITDMGSGSVKLTWLGMNNESDFSGYNIYGAKITTSNTDIEALEGKAIQLLDDSGNVKADGKTTLAKMAYNGTDWETAGAESTKDDGSDLKFYAYYAAKATDGTPRMPTCLPEKTVGSAISCKTLTADATTSTFNGTSTITLTGLKGDGKYCFAVFATLKGGKKISQTSTPVQCVVPRSKITYAFTSAISNGSGQAKGLVFSKIRTACSTGHACTSLDSNMIVTASNVHASGFYCTSSTTENLCVEKTNSTAPVQFTPEKDAIIRDLGYYPNGFEDTTFKGAPKVQAAFSSVANADGYTVQDKSIPLIKDHIYVLAERASSTSTDTTFYYHFIRVTSLGTSNSIPELEFRISTKLDAR